MSFPFYNRSSKQKEASVSFEKAKEPLPQLGPPGEARSPGHLRSSSRMRIPFLGKRRKSLATLRPNSLTGDKEVNDSGYGRHGSHNKTVSQLVDETAARMAGRSSLGAAGSLSTGNLELPNFNVTPLKPGSAVVYSSPTKERSQNARYTMFSSVSSIHPTPVKPQQAEKSKPSFLARVTSRPSLSARYSSADLKYTATTKQDMRGTGKLDTNIRPQNITHGVPNFKARDVADDRNIFTSPRSAPSPPSLQFASPSTFSQDSLLVPSESAATPSSRRQSLAPMRSENAVASRRQSIQPLSTPTKASTRSPQQAQLSSSASSPTTARNSPTPGRGPNLFPPALGPTSTVVSNQLHESMTAVQPRPGLVRIGSEKVTLSVANVLETELGVLIHDSEDESVYDDSYGSQYDNNSDLKPGLAADNRELDFHLDPSSDLPPLSASSDEFFNLISKYPAPARHIEIDSKSPLSVLINASAEDGSATESDDQRLNRHPYSGQRQSLSETSLRTFSFPSGKIDRTRATMAALDRISEKSVTIGEEPQQAKSDTSKPTGTTTDPTVAELQQSLKLQCARFDRLAGHLLSIIQRHQNEKLHFENQISSLEKEARRREREIKGLRWLLMRNNGSAANDAGVTCGPVRVSSMQSFFSVAASNDGEVDLEHAVKLLSSAGRRESAPGADSDTKEVYTSTERSPASSPKRLVRSDLRRTRTMPDLHKSTDFAGNATLSEHTLSSPPLPLPTPSPDVSGLGLGLDFPLPEPLALPSISSAIMSSAPGSATSVPTLTAAPTATSGLSIVTDSSASDNGPPPDGPPPPLPASNPRNEVRGGKSSREKRMAREWRPCPLQSKGYSPIEKSSGNMLPASIAYANNLNKSLSPSIDHFIKADGSAHTVDLDAIYQRLVARTDSDLE